MVRKLLLLVVVIAVVVGGVVAYLMFRQEPVPVFIDDAKAAGKKPEDLRQLKTDLFKNMDGGSALSSAEIQGRNAWIAWTAGSQVFLDRMAKESFGIIDLLKTLDSRKRGERFRTMGLVNEPGFKKATQPDEHGLWLDVPQTPDDQDLGETDALIAKELKIDPKKDTWEYGRSTGVMGLRLFPNPNFDEKARKSWDPERYYDPNDSEYWAAPDLVRPYRVGMTCGICHVAPHPLNPPADPEAPEWRNLASAIGNQYIREGFVFAINLTEQNFLWHMAVDLQPPGTSDTSRIATDHINNPNAINAIFNVPSRLEVARGHRETMGEAQLLLPGDPEINAGGANPRAVPHILKDGADSFGVPGATIRVYINIGMYSQQWLELHNPLLGVRRQTPFSIANAQENSVYWMATQQRLGNIKSFLASVKPFHLGDAKAAGPDDKAGADFVTKDKAVRTRGKLVFAKNCAKCHSSKLPPDDVDSHDTWFEKSVLSDDFLVDNFLSDERRHPVSKLKTNAARALGTNSTRGNIWDNFSSETYKELPEVGEITVYNPVTERNDYKFTPPGGGVGYYRTPSLISLWSSAPFLHNNSLGRFTNDPSVTGRMDAFNDAVEKLLWPEKRENVIWRTKSRSSFEIPIAALPDKPKALKAAIKRIADKDGYLRIGPVPAGTPVNLLASLSLGLSDLRGVRDAAERVKNLTTLVVKLKKELLLTSTMSDEEALAHMKKELVPALMDASKCPDLVEDRGHEFGKDLPDEDKRALIEFLKMF